MRREYASVANQLGITRQTLYNKISDMDFKHYNRLLVIRLVVIVGLAFAIGCLVMMGNRCY